MYLKKVDGPRSVRLPDGSFLTRSDLPPIDTKRWVASRKAVVVQAVSFGLISLSDVKKMYELSDEEYDSWVHAVRSHGYDALKITSLKRYRQS